MLLKNLLFCLLAGHTVFAMEQQLATEKVEEKDVQAINHYHDFLTTRGFPDLGHEIELFLQRYFRHYGMEENLIKGESAAEELLLDISHILRQYAFPIDLTTINEYKMRLQSQGALLKAISADQPDQSPKRQKVKNDTIKDSECIIMPAVAAFLKSRGHELTLPVQTNRETLLLFKHLLYAYFYYVRGMELFRQQWPHLAMAHTQESRDSFIQNIRTLIEQKKNSINIHDLEMIAHSMHIEEFMTATSQGMLVVSASGSSCKLKTDLAEFFVARGYDFFTRDSFSPDYTLTATNVTALAALCTEQLNQSIKENDLSCMDRAVDIAEWMLESSLSIENLPVQANQINPQDRENLFNNQKGQGGVKLNAGNTSVVIPPKVAAFFPSLAIALPQGGGFTEAQNGEIIMQEYDQSALYIFKQILCSFYRYCVRYYPGLSFEEINKNNNDDQFIAYLKKILTDVTKKHHDCVSDLLSIAALWDVRSLIHAIVQILPKHTNDEAYQSILNIPPALLPIFMSNRNNALYAIQLLDLLVGRNPNKVPSQIVDECTSSLANNLLTHTSYHDRPNFAKLNQKLQLTLKRHLLEKFAIPNFKRIWDLRYELGRDHNVSAKVAWRTEDTTVFFFTAHGTISSYADGDDYKHSRPRASFQGETKYTHAIHGRALAEFLEDINWEMYIGALADGTVIAQRNPGSDEPEDAPIEFMWQPNNGGVKDLAACFNRVAVAYGKGPVVLFKVHKDTAKDSLPPKVEHFVLSGTEHREGEALTVCLKVGISAYHICGYFDSGIIKIWDADERTLIKELSLPVKGDQVAALTLFGYSLYVGLKDSTILHFDLSKIQEKDAQQAKYMTILKDGHDSANNRSITVLHPVHAKLLIVGYTGGRTRIWNSEEQRIIKTIDFVADPITYTLQKGMLEIIYANGVVDRHLIPECADLEDIVGVMMKSDLE